MPISNEAEVDDYDINHKDLVAMRRSLHSHGLDLSPVAKIADGMNHNMVVARRAVWVLSWHNPTLMGKTHYDNPADFLAEQCERGVPLFEKAWIFFCRMMLEGRAESAYVGKPKQ